MLANGHSFEEVAPHILGYGVSVGPDLSYSLQRTSPKFADRVHTTLTDYLGNTFEIDAPEAIALYPASRVLGDPLNGANYANIAYLRERGVDISDEPVSLFVRDGKPVIQVGEFDTIE